MSNKKAPEGAFFSRHGRCLILVGVLLRILGVAVHLVHHVGSLFLSFSVSARDIHRIQRVKGGGFSHVAVDYLSSPAVPNSDILGRDMASLVVALDEGLVHLLGKDAALEVDFGVLRHGYPFLRCLLVGVLVALALVNVVFRVVPVMITTQFMGVAFAGVGVFTGNTLILALTLALDPLGVMDNMGKRTAHVTRLGMTKNVFRRFMQNVVDVFPKDFTKRPSEVLGGKNNSGFGQGAMTRRSDGALPDGLVILDLQLFGYSFHFPLPCPPWANFAGYRQFHSTSAQVGVK